MPYYDQSDYRVRFEWGADGLKALQDAEAVVVIDVLSFSTCVDIVTSQGGAVHPYPYKDVRASENAKTVGASLAAANRSKNTPSLSPASLLAFGPRSIVLPSPNGSEISLLARDRPCFAACIRNAAAVANALNSYGSIAVIAAGERWQNGAVRFAIEDMLGAGAVIAKLAGPTSPEARSAEALFQSVRNDLGHVLRSCASGRELIERGFLEDVELAAELDASESIPKLVEARFVHAI